MKPSVILAESTTADGQRVSLQSHDGQFYLYVGNQQLMNTTATGSEQRMAELACEKLGRHAAESVLIGGLGFGFTLRRVLELVRPGVRVQVAELMPVIVNWNREYLRSVNGGLVDDPRVEVLVEDVVAVLARATEGQYDAVLLDVDNGPAALVDRGNSRLYGGEGLRTLSRVLRPGGRAVFWSGTTDRGFLRRLLAAGFQAEAIGAKAYAKAKHETHTLFVADREG